ncbi:MAG: hypothetical protein MK135_16735, partial [Polyangiaceae bacterium]|nr:hypothetical protein [Polyangiaceae bacterium]
TTVLTGGLGVGTRVFDGRARQPGRESKRPRGLPPGAPVPAAARAAFPGSLAATGLSCAYTGGASLLACVRPAIPLAKAAGELGRAQLLEEIAQRGHLALSEGATRRSLLAEFGAVEGGIFGAGDLLPIPAMDCAPIETEDDFRPAWYSDSVRTAEGLGPMHSIVAVDMSGLFAGISFYKMTEGVLWPSFGVTLPAHALPVFRGMERTPPGSVLPTATTLRLTKGAEGQILSIEAQGGESEAAMRISLSRSPHTKEVLSERTRVS